MNEELRLTAFLISAFSGVITLRAIGTAIQRIANEGRVIFWDDTSKILTAAIVVLNSWAYITHDYNLYVAIFMANLWGWYNVYYIRKTYLKNKYLKSDGLSLDDAHEFDLFALFEDLKTSETVYFDDIMTIKYIASKQNKMGEWLYYKMKVELLKDVQFPFQFHPMYERVQLVNGASTMQVEREIHDLEFEPCTVQPNERHNFTGTKGTVFISEFTV